MSDLPSGTLEQHEIYNDLKPLPSERHLTLVILQWIYMSCTKMSNSLTMKKAHKKQT